MLGCIRRTFRPPCDRHQHANPVPVVGFLAGHHFMPRRSTTSLTPEHAAIVLAEALRRVDAGIPDHAVDLHALRQALETEQAKGPCSLVKLMKVGRRRALDRIRRAAIKKIAETAAPDSISHPNG